MTSRSSTSQPDPCRRRAHGAMVLALLAFGVAPAAAAPDAARIAAGREIAAKTESDGAKACNACHGANGEGQAASGSPRLAGLDARYLTAQMTAFGNGTRDNSVMSPIVATMDATARENVSLYYASLDAPAAPAPRVPHPDVAKGERLAMDGDWSANIPPCAACHGKTGHGVGAVFPAIAGQLDVYIVDQLRAWRTGARHDDPLALMRTIAGRVSEAQATEVAAYYASLPAGPSHAPDAAP